MDDDTFARRIMILAYGAILAAFAWVARTLRSEERPGALRMLGGIMGASIASFSFGAIVQEYFDVSNLFILGASGVVGWLGGDVLAALATFLERKFGLGGWRDQ